MRESVKDTTPAVAQQLPPDPLASAVARSVSDLRHSAGLSERAAARKLGTSQTQLRRMEDPRYLPSLRSLARLATVYAVTNDAGLAELSDDAVLLGAPLSEALTPISFVVVAQLVALSLARRRGRDVERPRGLSKVTRTR